jgi:hypothetical protein
VLSLAIKISHGCFGVLMMDIGREPSLPKHDHLRI